MFRNGVLFFFVEENREIGRDWRTETLPLNLGNIVSAVKGKITDASYSKDHHKFVPTFIKLLMDVRFNTFINGKLAKGSL